jgi:hypothetical protein
VGIYRYQITIGGDLGDAGCEAFEGFKIEPDGENTLLVADMDQSALFGALNWIQFLGLELVDFIRLADDTSI